MASFTMSLSKIYLEKIEIEGRIGEFGKYGRSCYQFGEFPTTFSQVYRSKTIVLRRLQNVREELIIIMVE